jgi:hypothetical protein
MLSALPILRYRAPEFPKTTARIFCKIFSTDHDFAYRVTDANKGGPRRH